MSKPLIIRACTVSQSLGFVKGLLPELKKKYEVILLSSPGSEMDELMATYDVRGIGVNMERHISLFKDIVSLVKIIHIFFQEKPNMVHSMTPKAGLLCMVAAWVTRVPIRVHTFTGLVFPTSTGLKKKILMFTDWLTCACATHVIPEGEGVKNDLLNNGITKKQLKVLGYGNVRGVDMDYFSVENFKQRVDSSNYLNLKIDNPESVTFLFVGRIVRDKGINELVEAFSMLHKKYSSTRLWLVGPYEDELDPISEEASDEISNNDSIKVVGVKQGDGLLAYYASADCFILPSYREGFPNTVLEAGAMGLPCIVTDINGSREIIENNVNGLIVPSKDVDALYKAMKIMIEDKITRKQMASVSRQKIAERFEQSFVRKCLYDFYDTILG